MKDQHKRVIPMYDKFLALKTNNHVLFMTNTINYFGGASVERSKFKKFHIDLSSQVCVSSKLTNFIKIGKLDSIAKNFYTSAFSWILKVIKFAGKGYRLRKFKKNKVLEMNFNNSHVTRSVAGSSVFRRLSKIEIGLINNNKLKSKTYLKTLLSVRELNVFTKRGLRSTKQFILKRPGKKNTN